MINVCALILVGNIAFSPCNVKFLEPIEYVTEYNLNTVLHHQGCVVHYKDNSSIRVDDIKCSDLYPYIVDNEDDSK